MPEIRIKLLDIVNELEKSEAFRDFVRVVRCEECKHYKQSEVDPNRKMCCRKDVDGWHVCYDFYPTDFCSYGKRREDE